MKDKRILLAVLAQLEREKTVSIPQLAQLLDTDEGDVYAALEQLVFAYDAVGIRLDLHGSHASLLTHGTTRLLRLTPPETETLIDALESVGISYDDPLMCALLSAKSVLENPSGDTKTRVHLVASSADPDIARVVAAACEDDEHHLLEIAYQGIDDAHLRVRVIEPAALFSEDGHRYVFAYCRDADAWRSFRLDRIRHANILRTCFEARSDMPSRGSVLEDADTQARISFAPDCPLPDWKGLRLIRTLDNGTRLASIAWTESSWLPRHIVALGGAALPIEPPELVEACKTIAEEIVDRR